MDLYDSNLDKKHRKEDHDREEELKQLLAKDVNENFELVVLIYQHRLKAYAYCLLHHEQNAEDVLQEVFISAYRALLKRSPAQIKTLKLTPWLFTAVHHRCINQISIIHFLKNAIFAQPKNFGDSLSVLLVSPTINDDGFYYIERFIVVRPDYVKSLHPKVICNLRSNIFYTTSI